MRPLSLAVPKELLPFGPRPAIEAVIIELAVVGIRDFIIIISNTKEEIRRYLTNRISDRDAPDVMRGIRLSFCYQNEPRGNAHAIFCAQHLLDERSFIVAYPDQIIRDNQSIHKLLTAHAKTKASVVQIIRIGPSHSGMFANSGVVAYEALGNLTRIQTVSDKKPERLIIESGTVRRIFGRMLLTRDFLRVVSELEITRAEVDDIPILQRIAAEGALYGVDIEEPYYDIGHLRSYQAAMRAEDAWRPA